MRRQPAQAAAPQSDFDLRAALGIRTPAPTPSLLRGLAEGDIAQLLAAIKQGPAAVEACLNSLGSALGLSQEQRHTIDQLAQTLARGQNALVQAQTALSQAQLNHSKATRALSAAQQRRGLPSTPVTSAICDPKPSAVEQAQPQWAQFPTQTILPGGEGPRGGFGEGFSSPSLKERVAQAALASQQAAQQTAQSAAPATPPVPATPAISAPAAPAQPAAAASATSDFLKKVDYESKFDFSQQQQDLAAIRAGAVGFDTQVLDLAQVDEGEQERQRADDAASQVIMDTLPQLRTYFQELDTAAKNVEKQLTPAAAGKGADYATDILSAVAGIRKAKSDLAAGIKPGAADSGSAAPAEDSFSLSQQGSTGFDVNDPRHLGAQLVGSVSLAAHESAAAPGGSFELPTTSATSATPSTVPVAPNPEPAVHPEPVTELPASGSSAPDAILAQAQAVAGSTTDLAVPVAPETPRVLSPEVNRSLQSMVSSLQAAEGHSADDLSIDDIMGSNLGSESLSELTPVATAQVSATPTRAPSVDGAASTELKPDLPPWDLHTPTPKEQPATPSVSAIALAPQAELTPQNATAVAAPAATPSAPQAAGSAEVSVVGSAQDQLLLQPQGAKVKVDGSVDRSAAEAAQKAELRRAAQDLEALDQRTSQRGLTDEERHAQQQKVTSAAFDVLSTFGQKLEKDLELTQNLGPSPWDELYSVQVLSIDNHDFKVKHPKLEKLQRVSEHNMLVSTDSAPSPERSNTIGFAKEVGETWPQQGSEAIIARLQNELPQERAEKAQAEQQAAAFNELLQQQIAQGLVHAGDSAELQAILAERNQSLAAAVPPAPTAPAQSAAPAQPTATSASATPAPAQPAAASVAAPQAPVPPQDVVPPYEVVAPSVAQPVAPQAPVASVAAPQVQPITAPQAPMPPQDVVPPYEVVAPARSQPAAAMPQPAAQMVPPQVAPTDFGPAPDYITEADDYLDAASMGSYVAVDSDSGDDDDDINDVDFGQAGVAAGMAADPDLPPVDIDQAALALSEYEPAAPEPEVQMPVAQGAHGVVPGRRRVTPDDFLEQVAKEDPWYQLLLQVFPDRGPIYATLTGVERLIDPNDPNHWLLRIDRNVDLSFIDPDFWNNVQRLLEQHLHTKLHLEVQPLEMTPNGAPSQRALIKQHEALVHAREDVKKIKQLSSLFKVMGENWDQVGIELYHRTEG